VRLVVSVVLVATVALRDPVAMVVLVVPVASVVLVVLVVLPQPLVAKV